MAIIRVRRYDSIIRVDDGQRVWDFPVLYIVPFIRVQSIDAGTYSSVLLTTPASSTLASLLFAPRAPPLPSSRLHHSRFCTGLPHDPDHHSGCAFRPVESLSVSCFTTSGHIPSRRYSLAATIHLLKTGAPTYQLAICPSPDHLCAPLAGPCHARGQIPTTTCETGDQCNLSCVRVAYSFPTPTKSATSGPCLDRQFEGNIYHQSAPCAIEEFSSDLLPQHPTDNWSSIASWFRDEYDTISAHGSKLYRLRGVSKEHIFWTSGSLYLFRKTDAEFS
jgi:hypothetical protein